MELSEEQRAIVNEPLGKHVVIAVPGSGKTMVSSHRVAALIERKDVEPKECLVFSYTRMAAQEITNRTMALLKDMERAAEMHSGTLHSFCYNESLDYTDRKKRKRVISSVHEMALFELDLVESVLKGKYDSVLDLEPERFRDLIDKYNEEVLKGAGSYGSLLGVIEKEIAKSIGDADKKSQAKNADPHHQRWRAYLEELETDDSEVLGDGLLSIMINEGIYTFGSMIMIFYKLLTTDEHEDYVFDRLSGIKYMVVDEFQDMRTAETKTLERMAEIIPGSLFCGDLAQTIYCEKPPEAMLSMMQSENFKIMTLTGGYRCPERIAEASNYMRATIYQKFISKIGDTLKTHDGGQVSNSLRAPEGLEDRGRVRITRCMGTGTPRNKIAEIVLNTLRSVHGGTVCYMARTNNEARIINSVLEKAGRDTSIKHTHISTYQEYHLLLASSMYHYMIRHGGKNPGSGPLSILNRFKTVVRNVASMQTIAGEGSKTLESIRMSPNEVMRRNMIFRTFQKYVDPFIREVVQAAGGNNQTGVGPRRRALPLCTTWEAALDLVKMESDEDVDDFALLICGQRGKRKDKVARILKQIKNMEDAPKNIPEYGLTAENLIKMNSAAIPALREHDKRDEIIEHTKSGLMKYLLSLLKARDFLLHGTETQATRVAEQDGRMKETVSLNEEKYVTVVDTIHSRKGLEYDHVYIVLPSERLIVTSGKTTLYPEMCAEYVAMTRGKRTVDIYLYEVNTWRSNGTYDVLINAVKEHPELEILEGEQLVVMKDEE